MSCGKDMFFCWDIAIEADTSDKTPLEQELSLPRGVITKVDIKFPAGCHGMVGVRLFHCEQQAIPLSSDEWVTGDDETVPTNTYLELTDEPYKLKLRACSPDTEYDHTITVRVDVQLEEVAGMAVLTRYFKNLLDALGVPTDE